MATPSIVLATFTKGNNFFNFLFTTMADDALPTQLTQKVTRTSLECPQRFMDNAFYGRSQGVLVICVSRENSQLMFCEGSKSFL